MRTVREVVAAAAAPTFDVARLLYRLAAAHLVAPRTTGEDASAAAADVL